MAAAFPPTGGLALFGFAKNAYDLTARTIPPHATDAMKIYTKTGDGGATSLFGGPRVSKDHERIQAYGTVDELNASIGLARAECARFAQPAEPALLEELHACLGEIQHRLFDLGAELACPEPEPGKTALLTEHHVEDLEALIDRHEARLPPLREFVLPGGSAPSATLHVARCVCRRAERLVVTLGETQPIREVALHYLNRLSDLLFVLSRAANVACGAKDTVWVKGEAAKA